MKPIILLMILAILSLNAEIVTVFENNGQMKTYDVVHTGTTTTVYDYQTNSFKTITR